MQGIDPGIHTEFHEIKGVSNLRLRSACMERNIVYFEKKGKQNTEKTLRLARIRAEELGIGQIVLASTHGYTALKAAEIFKGAGIEIIAVSISTAFDREGWMMSTEERQRIEQVGVRALTTIHGLDDGVAEGLCDESTPGRVVSYTLRLFSQGMKVDVEVSIMALEASLFPPAGKSWPLEVRMRAATPPLLSGLPTPVRLRIFGSARYSASPGSAELRS